ncbi:HET-domain-containing protein [Fusarium austroafricanum]|uniref:HET-domain-containing protein n=1 Tax=Fusarium austroafricanum TaxID=2364996 RepID=A0A8H4JR01_9HYPO|nr:HET-domain-containing protein [Fusarium austroafricanum]
MDMEPRDLVCARCWRDFFDTESFEKCCTAENPDYSICVEATATVEETRNAASSGCNWCAYIARLIDDPKYIEIWTEGKQPGERHVNVWMTPSIAKGYTPKGRNIFWLRLDFYSPTGEHKAGRSSQTHAFTAGNDIASEYVTARPLRTDVGSQVGARQMKTWLEECKEHGCCSNSQKESILPTRIIEVNPPDQPEPRIIETQGLRGVYATISYCWGSVPFQTLNTSNYSQLTKRLDMNTLPLTVQDAITTTRRLKIPYIWIDALCIIQDSDQDKNREIALMKDIYASSALTIVAASARHVFEGFLSDRSQSEEVFQVPFRIQPGLFGTMCVNELAAVTYEERSEPLAKRAWTLQEQLLAPRTLTFATHTMIWCCKAGAKNFGDSLYFPREEGRMAGPLVNTDHDLNLNSLLATEEAEGSSNDVALSRWMRLVMAYSLRIASLEKDKLNAIAGIASHPSFVSILGPQYLAGMWEYELARQLTWYPKAWYKTLPEGEKFTFYRPTTYRAPSWSWASLEGGFIYVDFVFNYEQGKTPKIVCDVIECSTTPKFPEGNPFGEVISAYLKLRGSLRTAWFYPQSSSVCFVDPETVYGGNRSDVYGICDESGVDDPMFVSCLPVSLDETIPCGAVGLLLTDEGQGVYKRVGLFMRGTNQDFENLPKTEVTIL